MTANGLLGGERNAPPHFAGRTEELAALAGYAAYVFQNSDPSGGIALIDGVPGSGKTQLLREFVRRWQAADRNVLSLAVTTADTPVDAKGLMFLIASAMPIPKRQALGVVGEERRAKSISLAGIGKFDWDNPKAPDLPITEMLRLSKDTGWWEDQAMILSIDEIQPWNRPLAGCSASSTRGCTAARSWWRAPACPTRCACWRTPKTIRTPSPAAPCA